MDSMTGTLVSEPEEAAMTTPAIAEKTFERLPSDPFLPCDGHAEPNIQAVVLITLPGGGIVYLCGHCARKAGWEHTDSAPAENRQQGSSH